MSAAIDRNLGHVAKLEAAQIEARSLAERIAGVVTRVAGTATFAIIHVVWFAGWIRQQRIHPAGSQSQMSRQADRREHLDLQINLLAEQESTATLRLVTRIAERLGIDAPDVADKALTVETDVAELASAVSTALPDPPAKASSLPPSTQA